MQSIDVLAIMRYAPSMRHGMKEARERSDVLKVWTYAL